MEFGTAAAYRARVPVPIGSSSLSASSQTAPSKPSVANASAAVAAVLFGASVVAVRMAVRDVPPLALAFLRFGLGALALFAALLLVGRDRLRIQRRDVPSLALLGLLFYGIFPITFNAGLRYIEASRAALILATMPLWTVILARRLARERLTLRQVSGVLISVAGVAIVMADRGVARSAASTKGDLLLATTALCGAIYNVAAKRVLARHDGVTVTFYAMLFGSLFLAPTLILERGWSAGASSLETIMLIVFLGVFGGAVAFSMWTSALRRLSPTQVAVYINLNPLAATFLAATVLGERLTLWFVVGFVAVAAGVIIVNWAPPPPPPPPPPRPDMSLPLRTSA
jgi:drug/metabolite transporter (DMT)-like permease